MKKNLYKEPIFYFLNKNIKRIEKLPIFSFFFNFFNRKNFILENSEKFDKFFKKSLGIYYNQSEILNEMFFSKKVFSFSDLKDEKNKIIEIINNEFPKFKEKVIESANKILMNKIQIFEKLITFKDSIKWNHSIFLDKYWPLKNSTKINIAKDLKNIDIRYNWELNRQQFLVNLGLAYYFTGDEKYSKKLISIILDWIKKNPPRFNTAWISPFMISMTTISWIFSLYLLKGSSNISENIFIKIFKSLFQQAYFIFKNSKKYTFNHLIGEQFGLFLFSFIFIDIKRIEKWYLNSLKLLLKQFNRQILPDGVFIEKTINYHRVVLEIYSLMLIINPNLFNNYQKSLINKMYTFLAYIIKPDHSVSLVGDFDDNHIIPSMFFNNIKKNFYFRELLSLGVILLKRGDLKILAKEISPATILLNGTSSLNKYKSLYDTKSFNKHHFFGDGGFFIARNNFSNTSNYLLYDMASFAPYRGGHDHLDISNIIVSHKGKPILIDSGTYRYNDSITIRNKFRTFKAHNVLEIKGENRIFGFSNFGWNISPHVKGKLIELKNNYELIVNHDCFKNFITVRKLIASKNLDNIKILDVITLKKKLKNKIKINLYFHFDKDTLLEIQNREIIINKNLKMFFDFSSDATFKIKQTTYPYSHSYGFKINVPFIIIEFIYKITSLNSIKIKTTISTLN